MVFHVKRTADATPVDPAARTAALVASFAERHRITLPPEVLSRAARLWELAIHLSAAARIGLTNYTNPDQLLQRLLLPTIAVFRWLDPTSPLSIAELGCGAGPLGLTLAVLVPDWTVFLVDRRDRAVAFVDVVRLKLGISNAVAIQADAARPIDQRPVDAALFRAVASPEEDLNIARAWLKPRGLAVIWTAHSEGPPTTDLWQPLQPISIDNPPLLVLAYRLLSQAE